MQSFDLVTQPWIKVKYKDSRLHEVSLETFFKDLDELQDFAGETKPQDLAIMRYILAMIITAKDRKQDIFDYLHQAKLDFYQSHVAGIVDQDFYKTHTDKPFDPTKLKGGGIVPLSTINRLVNESDSGYTTWSPVSNINKNKLSETQLIRWLFAYQQAAGTTSKPKIPGSKYSIDSGFLDGTQMIYLEGRDLKDTLTKNGVACGSKQAPFWEMDFEKYLTTRRDHPEKLLTNTAEIYTTPAKMLYVSNGHVWATGLPKFDRYDNFDDPMTVTKFVKGTKKEPDLFKPATLWGSSRVDLLNIFTNDDTHAMPAILRSKQDSSEMLKIHLLGLVNDGTSASQIPIDTVDKVFTIEPKLLVDPIMNQKLAQIINNIEQVRTYIYHFGNDAETLRGASSNNRYLGTQLAQNYKSIIEPEFIKALPNLDSHNFYETMLKIVQNLMQNYIRHYATHREFVGKDNIWSIYGKQIAQTKALLFGKKSD